MDSNAVWLLALGGFAAALGAWLFIKFRLGGSWLIKRARNGYLGWFKEAVDQEIAPKIEAVMENTRNAAMQVTEGAVQIAQQVKDQLDTHTREEGELVRGIVREEVAPIQQILDGRTPMFERIDQALAETNAVIESHLTADELIQKSVDARFRESGEELLRGQTALLARLEAIEAAVTTVTTTVTTSPQGEEPKEPT